jgi:hypothetical protein
MEEDGNDHNKAQSKEAGKRHDYKAGTTFDVKK